MAQTALAHGSHSIWLGSTLAQNCQQPPAQLRRVEAIGPGGNHYAAKLDLAVCILRTQQTCKRFGLLALSVLTRPCFLGLLLQPLTRLQLRQLRRRGRNPVGQ